MGDPDTCAICLDQPPKDPVHLACKHEFCYECILKWGTEVSNTCPLCKQRFREIRKHAGPWEAAIVVQQVKDRDAEVETEEGEAPDAALLAYLSLHCRTCGRDDDDAQLLICDGCEAGVHTYCCSPALTEVPQGDWYCKSCTEGQAASSVRARLAHNRASVLSLIHI
eukprot:TRINITY_DN50106_c0_g2_i1.p1 TRINITY_DN50106_c0_g2~~TRINITY_DN50106_c0_g2_i1.p1  ORF type:complete len:167 (+),score=23.28 TRINITY_DN50106_c0_g2_i1:103-603(+)